MASPDGRGFVRGINGTNILVRWNEYSTSNRAFWGARHDTRGASVNLSPYDWSVKVFTASAVLHVPRGAGDCPGLGFGGAFVWLLSLPVLLGAGLPRPKMDMKPQYSSLAYSTATEDIVDSSINSVLTTTLLKSRDGGDMHRTLTLEEVTLMTEPNKPCVIIDQKTLVGKHISPNSLFGNLRLMKKSM